MARPPGPALVVHAHPSTDSYNHALYRTVLRVLARPGREVVGLDLYRQGFGAVMSAEERRAYDDGILLDPLAQEAADVVRRAQVMVFVYPTWWFGPPAILKGWLERVLVPGVGFVLDPRTQKVRRGLLGLRRIVGVTTYGSPRPAIWAAGDGGHRTLARTLRLSAHPLARTTWLGLYGMDSATPADRAAFLARVEQRLARR